ncbi:MAG: hypothetical protein CMJ58_14660 [Planctomycetaceae bacterium]|nr:hypothetical protein [Planctomycetaceae bacterium]
MQSPRPGFEAARVLTRQLDDDDGLVLDATPAERMAMVWPLTLDCWEFTGAGDRDAQREFQRHLEAVRRGGSE